MLTILLAVPPAHELFQQGLDLALDAADGSELCQVIVLGELLAALSAPQLPQDKEERLQLTTAVKRLAQLELLEIPAFTCPQECPALPFALKLDFRELYAALYQSTKVLTF